MPVYAKPIPAPGFKVISGKRKPTDGEYFCQFRNGLIDEDHKRTPGSMVWLHTGSDWDIVAVRKVG
jgi:hypothetical protein